MSRWVVAECLFCGYEIRMRDAGLARLIAKVWCAFHQQMHRKEAA
jgi:hypothetical protein